LVPWLFPLCPLRLCGDRPNPVAYAHRQTSVALRAKTKQPDLYGRSTTKDPYARSSPSPPPRSPPAKVLGARGGQAVFIKRRDFGEINGTLRQKLHARRRIGTRAYRSQATIWSLGCFLCVLCAFAVIARIRWLTHTGRDMPPSGQKQKRPVKDHRPF
jgi:hypothetical protein